MTRCQIGQLCYFSPSVCLECSRAAASDQLLPVLGLLGCAIYQTVQMFAEHAVQETVLKSEDRLSGPAGRLSGPAGRLPDKEGLYYLKVAAENVSKLGSTKKSHLLSLWNHEHSNV